MRPGALEMNILLVTDTCTDQFSQTILFRNLFASSPICKVEKIAGVCSYYVEERITFGCFSNRCGWTILANFCFDSRTFLGCWDLRVATGK